MAEEYGILTRAQNGKMIEFNSGLRMIRQVYDGPINVNLRDGNAWTPLPGISPGSDIFLVPMERYYYEIPNISNLTGYVRENDGIKTWSDSYRGGATNISFRGKVFETLPASDPPEYGMLMTDSVQFATLGKSQISYITHMEEINFTGYWRIPDWVQGRENSVIYVSWFNANGELTIMLDGNGLYTDAIRGWRIINNGHGATSDGISATMRICVVATVPDLQMPDYGIAIWNNAGDLVFTTGYTPVSYSSYQIMNGTGSIETGLSRPMVPVLNYGFLGEGTSNWTYLFYLGVGMQGGRVYGRKGAKFGEGKNLIGRTMTLNHRMIILDSDKYF
ncbi:DUF6453 family protein [Serratia sp. CY81684]|uniref:DUF6453 family protein n=1 Tax=Serratia sp. CY81684 TaxID=3383686 RepID=UPI003F9F1637